MKTRLLCLMLLLCMLLPMALACNNQPADEGPQSDVSDSDSGSETENKYDVYDNLGEVDLLGRTITIASVDRSWYDDEVSISRTSGNIVPDAIYKRNEAVKTRLNIKISSKRLGDRGNNSLIQYAVVDDLRANVAGTHAYDIAFSPTYAAIMHTGANIFYDLRKLEAIDFEQPYWSQFFNETASYGGAQYMATGAISLSFYRFIFATYVNNKVLDTKADAPDLIQVVNDGKWTLEYQRQLANEYYSPVGSAATKTEQDTFGHVTSDYLNVDPYWSSCEMYILKKNDANYYELALDVDRISSVVDILVRAYSENGTYCYKYDSTHETGNGEQVEIAKKFASGEALMATIRLIEAENEHIRDMSDSYTILPIPRYSEDQEAYYSYVHDSFTSVCIPSTAKDDDAQDFGKVLEAMASESYRTVTPAYYETALKARYSGSKKSWEMLDMMTQNVYMDGGVLYTKSLQSVHQKLRNIAGNAYKNGKGNTTASTYNEEYVAKVQTALNTLQGELKALEKLN